MKKNYCLQAIQHKASPCIHTPNKKPPLTKTKTRNQTNLLLLFLKNQLDHEKLYPMRCYLENNYVKPSNSSLQNKEFRSFSC